MSSSDINQRIQALHPDSVPATSTSPVQPAGPDPSYARVQLARHPKRPHAQDYFDRIFTDFTEIHGDRAFGDDKAITGGYAFLDGKPVMVIGQQKGRDTKAKLARNFGMPKPEGYRKAMRLMKLADKFHRPIVCLIDTPGAYPGIDSEERGVAEAIAFNLREMARLSVPILAIVIGEGGSGGALGMGVANRVLMMENAYYSVISPESCAAIIWRDAGKAELAAAALKLTAPDLLSRGIIDGVVPEPPGGAQDDMEAAAQLLGDAIRQHLAELGAMSPPEIVEQRYQKFRNIAPFFSE